MVSALITQTVLEPSQNYFCIVVNAFLQMSEFAPIYLRQPTDVCLSEVLGGDDVGPFPITLASEHGPSGRGHESIALGVLRVVGDDRLVPEVPR